MKPTNFKQTCKYNKIMTSKEKADELAEEFLTFHQDGSKVYHIKIREAIEFAYNKCQQDMADYIFTVAKEFHRLGKYSGTTSDTHFTDIYEETINSLNKQDNDK